MRDYKQHMRVNAGLIAKIHTPYLDSVANAAALLKTTADQILFEIKMYAKRNERCHSGVKNMVKEGD